MQTTHPFKLKGRKRLAFHPDKGRIKADPLAAFLEPNMTCTNAADDINNKLHAGKEGKPTLTLAFGGYMN